MTQQPPRKLFAPIPPFDPTKRSKTIQDAIAKRKIKRNDIIDDILALLSQLVEQQEKQSA